MATTFPPAPTAPVVAAIAELAAGCRLLLTEEGLRAQVAFEPVGEEAPPAAPAWLGRLEQAVFDGLVVPKRRRDWLAGRAAAKRAVALLTGAPAAWPDGGIEILARASGAPGVTVDGRPSSARLSIAHAGNIAAAIAWDDDEVSLGLDLEPLVAPGPFLERVAFTAGESAWARGDVERVLALWTAKEAVLKALELGLRLDLRHVEVSPGAIGAAWPVRHRDSAFRVRHLAAADHVVAVAAGRGASD